RLTDALVLREVLRLEAVGDQRRKQPVLGGHRLQLPRLRRNDIDPGEARLLELNHHRLAHRERIRLAAAAAPKPLSMFTTSTPDAQELSMPSSAARPPKDAPYPTLVGTAITGCRTSPPTTLGSVPSIPATTMMTSASANWSRAARSRWRPATPTSINRSTR